MPFLEQTHIADLWARRASRVLLNGPPNTGKTRSFYTWPGPMIVVSYPGEHGVTSIPSITSDGVPVKAFVWEEPDLDNPVAWVSVLAQVQKITFEVLQGKHGPVTTFAGDGLHKLYEVFLNAVTNGARAKGEDFDPKRYGASASLFSTYLQKVFVSPVQNVVMTSWSELEKDDPDEKGSNVSRHVLPRLPGKQAQDVMGEFPVVLYAMREGSGPTAKFYWQTQPFGRVWGAGIKVPATVRTEIPLKVPQDWAALERLLIPETQKERK